MTSGLKSVTVARDENGFVLTGNAQARHGGSSSTSLEANVPGVFAVGDVRSGSVKRVGAAIGDGAGVVALIYQLAVKA